MTDKPTNTPPMQVQCLGTVTFTYTNWRGETAQRRAVFERMFYGSTEWHPEPQWIMEATDLGKPADMPKTRQFALRDMRDVTYEP